MDVEFYEYKDGARGNKIFEAKYDDLIAVNSVRKADFDWTIPSSGIDGYKIQAVIKEKKSDGTYYDPLESFSYEFKKAAEYELDEFNIEQGGDDFVLSYKLDNTGNDKAADGSGTAYTDEDSIYLTEDTTLYAQWTKRRTSSGGGGGTPSNLGTVPTPKPTAEPSATADPDATPAPDATAAPSDGSGTASERFIDVPRGQWYHDPVYTAFDNGLMNGVSDNTLAPEGDVTRAMFVTTLYRLDGQQQADSSYSFEDVDYDAYYGNAVVWASGNGIVLGYDDKHFGPNDNVTREQMAAMLYRYARYKAVDVSAGEDTNILSYTDVADISEYAVPAIQYASGAGIINGFEDGTLRPASNATRAQLAAILNKAAELFK